MSEQSQPMGKGLTFAMAAACGVAVANIYYCQPMLGLMKQDFAGDGGIGLVPTATQLGYALGLFLLVPLGDIMDRRRLIVGQFLVLAAMLVGNALAPTTAGLLVASFCVGMGATVAQQIVPFAAGLASPERRGRVIGTVMGGLLCGLLFSRTLAGFVGTHLGWRAMFWLAVPLSLAMAGVMAAALPSAKSCGNRLGYGGALRSLWPLWRDELVLRRATLLQCLLFATFTSFWAILAFHLEEPSFHLGADVAGLFGVVGAVGVFAAPIAGRLADRRGPGLVIVLGVCLILFSWVMFGAWNALPGLIIAVILLDFAIQSVLVSNQHQVYALRPEARSRLNTIFMTGMFVGGGLGSGGAVFVWNHVGWLGVCAYCGLLALAALVLRLWSAHKI